MGFSVGEKVYPRGSSDIYDITCRGNGYGVVVGQSNSETRLIWIRNDGRVYTGDDNEVLLFTVDTRRFSRFSRYCINDYDIYTEADNPKLIPGISKWLAIIVIKGTDACLTLNRGGGYMLSDKGIAPLDGADKRRVYDLFCKVHGKEVIENGLEGE